jgi:branched-chain amino acid transport system substrate-binding protein
VKKGLAAFFAVLFAPASFAGDAVTIGLFVPTRGPAAEVGTEVRKGAEIALAIANREGGLRGHPLRLATAASDLSWAAASSALVRLIYEEKAVAVVGALDGRSGHLAEQVITRARGQVVFVTPWASEDTLSRIRIPWFFRLVPDDRQQALILAGEIFSTRRIERAAVWVEASFDARAAAQAFEQAAPPGAATTFSAEVAGSAEDLIARACRGEFGLVVLFAQPRAAADLAARLRTAGCRAPLAGPLWLASPEFLRSGSAVEGTLLVAPARQDTKAMDEFNRMFEANHGNPPTPPALYAHDAVMILVEALRRAAGAPSGDLLGRTLEATSMHGLTGLVRFDENRDRDEAPAVARVEAGRLVALRRGAVAGGR